MNNVEKALELWIELTGVDPNAKKFKLGEWEIQKINDELKESMVLDKTYLTTLMLLDNFVTDYLNERSFTVNQMLSDYDNVLSYLEKSKELFSILKSEEIVEKKDEFQKWLMEALNHYQVQNDKVLEMAQSMKHLGFLRRDSLRSIETLEVHQFFQGKEDASKTPKYVTEVHEFWNINSLIRSMKSEETLSGISLNLIRDPLDSSSYFVFGIKNGETISIVTDRPNYVHPLQKYMTRRPGRDLANRMFQNHFPYGLLDIRFTQNGDAFVYPTKSTELTIYQEELRPLKKIKDLEPDEVVWIIMMFSLIKERFWDENFKTKELSYTGEMSYKEDVLIDNRNLVSVEEYKKLELEPIQKTEITTEKLKDDWYKSPTGKNSWLEKRYEEKINEQYLNFIGNSSKVLFLTTSNDLLELSQEDYKEKTRFISSELKGEELLKLDTSMFGSKEEVLKTQKWVARYNQAVMIKTEAELEFEEREKEIKEFYRKKIEANKDQLLKAIGRGVFDAPYHYRKEGNFEFGDSNDTAIKNILSIDLASERRYTDTLPSLKFGKRDDGYYCCDITGNKATLIATFRPKTAEAVALLCGCKVEELPDVLQHWTKAQFYSGNSILDNIDPIEWVVENPWNNVNLNVEIYLSKSSYNNICKDVGAKPNKFWLKDS